MKFTQQCPQFFCMKNKVKMKISKAEVLEVVNHSNAKPISQNIYISSVVKGRWKVLIKLECKNEKAAMSKWFKITGSQIELAKYSSQIKKLK